MSEPIRDRTIRSLPTAPVRHGRLHRSRAWTTILAILGGAMAVVLVSGGSVAAITVAQFNANIDVVELVVAEGEEPRVIPTVGEWEGGFNVLLVGIMLVLFITLAPQGIVGLVRKHWRKRA